MRAKSLNHTQRRFLRARYLVLRTSQDTAAGHFGLEACTQTLYCEFNINQATAYVWCLLGFLAAVLSSTDLNCYVWGTIKNMQNYCLSHLTSQTNLQRPWTGTSGTSFHSVLICVVPPGSHRLINQADTWSDTRGWGSGTAALGRHYEHLFFFLPLVLIFPEACELEDMPML